MKYHECNLLQNSILTRKTGNNLASRKKVRMQELRCCLVPSKKKKSWINEFYAMTLKWYASLIKVAWLVFPDQNHDLIFFDSHLELKKEVWHDQRYWDANTQYIFSEPKFVRNIFFGKLLLRILDLDFLFFHNSILESCLIITIAILLIYNIQSFREFIF